MAEKTFYKCRFCMDVHYGAAAPEICPTCKQKDAYDGVSADEARKFLGL